MSDATDPIDAYHRRGAAKPAGDTIATPPAARATQETLEQRVRDSGDLLARLADCRSRIGKMCSERRGPRMTIPLQWDDDDFFIGVTLKDATEMLIQAAQRASAVEAPTPQASNERTPDELSREIERKFLVAVMEADDAFEKAGATGTKTWVREFLLNRLEVHGLGIGMKDRLPPAHETSALICGRCGWRSESDLASFCSHCGKPLPVKSTAEGQS
jgi:hypothetical protein